MSKYYGISIEDLEEENEAYRAEVSRLESIVNALTDGKKYIKDHILVGYHYEDVIHDVLDVCVVYNDVSNAIKFFKSEIKWRSKAIADNEKDIAELRK